MKNIIERFMDTPMSTHIENSPLAKDEVQILCKLIASANPDIIERLASGLMAMALEEDTDCSAIGETFMGTAVQKSCGRLIRKYEAVSAWKTFAVAKIEQYDEVTSAKTENNQREVILALQIFLLGFYTAFAMAKEKGVEWNGANAI